MAPWVFCILVFIAIGISQAVSSNEYAKFYEKLVAQLNKKAETDPKLANMMEAPPTPANKLRPLQLQDAFKGPVRSSSTNKKPQAPPINDTCQFKMTFTCARSGLSARRSSTRSRYGGRGSREVLSNDISLARCNFLQ